MNIDPVVFYLTERARKIADEFEWLASRVAQAETATDLARLYRNRPSVPAELRQLVNRERDNLQSVAARRMREIGQRACVQILCSPTIAEGEALHQRLRRQHLDSCRGILPGEFNWFYEHGERALHALKRRLAPVDGSAPP